MFFKTRTFASLFYTIIKIYKYLLRTKTHRLKSAIKFRHFVAQNNDLYCPLKSYNCAFESVLISYRILFLIFLLMIQLCNITQTLTKLKVGKLLSMLGCICRETDVSFFR